MKLTVLISTIDTGIDRVTDVLLEKNDKVDYIICHQYTDEKYIRTPDGLKREDVQLTRLAGKGVTRSRNRGIDLATGDIVLFSDDDVQYRKEFFDIVLNTYKNNPELDVICFKIKTPEGQPEYKKYPSEPIQVVDFTYYYPSMVEMSFRLNPIKDIGIRFDEQFGLGSAHSLGGEEKIFLYDCWKKGTPVFFFPEYIVIHKYKDAEYFRAKSIVDKIRTMIALEIRTRGSSAFSNLFRTPRVMIKKIWKSSYHSFFK